MEASSENLIRKSCFEIFSFFAYFKTEIPGLRNFCADDLISESKSVNSLKPECQNYLVSCVPCLNTSGIYRIICVAWGGGGSGGVVVVVSARLI